MGTVMRDTNFQELKLKQSELFVAQQIFDELGRISKPDLYIEQLPLHNVGDKNYTFRDFHYQNAGLQRLVKQGLIQILNPNNPLKIGIHIYIVDIPLFKAFYTELFESIPAIRHGARIIYSTKTGRGKMNGKPFKLNRGSRNRQVFQYLVKHPNKYHSKKQLWKIAGEKGRFVEDQDGVIEFNTIITTLREALADISSKHLRLKKMVILDAEVTLTD